MPFLTVCSVRFLSPSIRYLLSRISSLAGAGPSCSIDHSVTVMKFSGFSKVWGLLSSFRFFAVYVLSAGGVAAVAVAITLASTTASSFADRVLSKLRSWIVCFICMACPNDKEPRLSSRMHQLFIKASTEALLPVLAHSAIGPNSACNSRAISPWRDIYSRGQKRRTQRPPL